MGAGRSQELGKESVLHAVAAKMQFGLAGKIDKDIFDRIIQLLSYLHIEILNLLHFKGPACRNNKRVEGLF